MNVTNSIIGFFAGIIGAMGMGGGGVLLIYLTAFAGINQLTAQGINLLFFLPIGFLAIIIYSFKKQVAWKTVLFMLLGGLLGAFLGYKSAYLLGAKLLQKLFACFLIVFGISQLFTKSKKEENKNVS